MCRKTGYIAERDVHISRWNLEDSVRNFEDEVYFSNSYVYSALTDGMPIIVRKKEGGNLSVNSFWGILPPWKHDFKEAVIAANNFVNIRSETVYESKLYAPLLEKKQRCLIPLSFYFEHHHFDQHGQKGQLLKSKLNVPFLVKTTHRPVFSVPALFSTWFDKENNKRYVTHSMFTISANDVMEEVHNGGDNPFRMPLVIDREMEERWLDKDTSDKDIRDLLNHQIHSSELSVWAVAPLSGKNAKTGAAIIEEEFWDRKEEIERIKNTGRQKQPTRALETV